MKLRAKCPGCSGRLGAIEGMTVATVIVHRTCRRRSCGDRWRIVVRPLSPTDGQWAAGIKAVHILDFAEASKPETIEQQQYASTLRWE